MKKQLVFGLALVAVAASWGCNNEIEVEHRTFKQLCENSGGEINQDDNRYCKCGNPKADCAIGVVCYNNGEFCANNDRICDKINAELQTKICQNNIDNVGQIRICAKNQISADDADISYSYIDYVSIPNQSNIENEYKNEYNKNVN